MLRYCCLILFFVVFAVPVCAQQRKADSTLLSQLTGIEADSTIDYDELFRDFDAFMDSILTPRNYWLASVTVGRGYYSFESKADFSVVTSQKLTYSPTIGYYHKSGLGITGLGYMVDDGRHMNFYQSSLSPSYDYLKDRNLATGISYTRYFTRDSLPFYTTPLQNELYAYFTWRKGWVKPMLSFSYGWGTRNDYEERETLIQDLRLRRRGFIYINTQEKISDLSVMASLRHDFYWLDVLAGRDYIRFTPQLTFTSGTQKFGFNQTSATYGTSIRTGSNVLFSSDNVMLDDQLKFQPLSLALFLRGEYSIGKFFIQPQFSLDYYLPGGNKNLNAIFAMSAGFIF